MDRVLQDLDYRELPIILRRRLHTATSSFGTLSLQKGASRLAVSR